MPDSTAKLPVCDTFLRKNADYLILSMIFVSARNARPVICEFAIATSLTGRKTGQIAAGTAVRFDQRLFDKITRQECEGFLQDFRGLTSGATFRTVQELSPEFQQCPISEGMLNLHDDRIRGCLGTRADIRHSAIGLTQNVVCKRRHVRSRSRRRHPMPATNTPSDPSTWSPVRSSAAAISRRSASGTSPHAAEMFLVLLAHIERICLKGILSAHPGIVDPTFDLRGRQIVHPARLAHRCLAPG